MRYRIKVKQSVDGEWVATCRSLPDVVFRGTTRQDAVHAVTAEIQTIVQRNASQRDFQVIDPDIPPARFWVWLHVSVIATPFALGAMGVRTIPYNLANFLLPFFVFTLLICPLLVLWSIVNRRQSIPQSLLALLAESLLCVLQAEILLPAVQ